VRALVLASLFIDTSLFDSCLTSAIQVIHNEGLPSTIQEIVKAIVSAALLGIIQVFRDFRARAKFQAWAEQQLEMRWRALTGAPGPAQDEETTPPVQ
jgi:hypothetical protein